MYAEHKFRGGKNIDAAAATAADTVTLPVPKLKRAHSRSHIVIEVEDAEEEEEDEEDEYQNEEEVIDNSVSGLDSSAHEWLEKAHALDRERQQGLFIVLLFNIYYF